MDHGKLDDVSRAIGRSATRREGITVAVGVLLGSRFSPGDIPDSALAVKRTSGRSQTDRGGRNPHVSGPCGNGSGKDNCCKKNGDCCTRYRTEDSCRCKPNWMNYWWGRVARRNRLARHSRQTLQPACFAARCPWRLPRKTANSVVKPAESLAGPRFGLVIVIPDCLRENDASSTSVGQMARPSAATKAAGDIREAGS